MKKKTKINIIVCGGNGFIGYNILEELIKNKNYNVYATFNHSHKKLKKVKWIKANLLNEKKVKKILKNKDIVIQAAAVTTGSKDIIKRPYIHITNNIVMNTLLLRSSYENHVRHFIFFSCTVMYNSSSLFHTEKSKNIIDENSNYFGVGNMKMYIEKQCLFYSKLKRTKFSILRHSNIYGPHDKFDANTSHVLPNFLNKALNKKKKFQIWGNGKSIRDYLYVKDLFECVKILISKQQKNFEIYNVGSENPISILNLAKKILSIANQKKEIRFVKNDYSIDNQIKINTKKIKSLNWKPNNSLDDGIEKTLNWYKDNIYGVKKK